MGNAIIPTHPAPRERFTAHIAEIETGADTWNTLLVEIRNRNGAVVANYERNHPGLYDTFEPFRQGDRMMALVSPDYRRSSVIDLSSGEIVAEEPASSDRFCPVGFFVPDWWDVHDGSILPGTSAWTDDLDSPRGEFGFVWGYPWGDEDSCTIQLLDLSRLGAGELRREDRFGPLKLAAGPAWNKQELITCSILDGTWRVTLAIEESFDLTTGLPSTD